MVDLRGQNVNDVKELEHTHDPSNHFRAILFRLECMKVVPEFKSGWKLVIFDPSDALIFRTDVLLEPSLHSFDKQGEHHTQSVNQVIGLANKGGLVHTKFFQLVVPPHQVALYSILTLHEISLRFALTPLVKRLHSTFTTKFIASSNHNGDDADLRAILPVFVQQVLYHDNVGFDQCLKIFCNVMNFPGS